MRAQLWTVLLMTACHNPSGPWSRSTIELKAKSPVSNPGIIHLGRCGPESVSEPFDRVYQALPARLQSEFPKSKEAFFVELQALSLCRMQSHIANATDFTPGLSDAFDACWRLGHDSVGRSFPQVLIQRDPAALHRNLIPMTVAAFAEFYIDDVFGPALDQSKIEGKKLRPEEEQLAQFVVDFRRSRQLLTQALIDDYRSAGLNLALSAWADRFQTSTDALGDSKAFQNFVLAGLTGSYYCNAESAAQFNANEFIRIRSAFIGMADFWGKPWYADAAPVGQQL